jgi:lipase chaperone LimK
MKKTIIDCSNQSIESKDFTSEEQSAFNQQIIDIKNEQLTPENIRKKRNALLAESDWTQIADATVDKTAWATYRQSLRDITTHSNFPDLEDSDWPTAP